MESYKRRKKVAVLLPWLKMGGTNKIALNFIRELSEYCDVTLILSYDTGELREQLPPHTELIIDRMKDFKEILKEDILRCRPFFLGRDVSYYMTIRSGKDSIDNYRYIVDRNDAVTEQSFDCAVSYHGQSPERLLNLLYRIHAKKKVVWIHGEMSFPEDKCRRLCKYYDRIDHFFFVSRPTLESFFRVIPFDRDKGTVYYNPVDKEDILRKAEEKPEIPFEKETFNILTVGRISPEKGQEMIPVIVHNLQKRGRRICWYLIGDGADRKRVEELCRQYGAEGSVHFLGTRMNPYSFMKACDLYVQPSYTEGYSTTICEAAILGKAIIGTIPSGGIRDQIEDGVDGMIVEASPSGLTEAIDGLLLDEERRHRFEKAIIRKNFEGKGEIDKFLAIL